MTDRPLKPSKMEVGGEEWGEGVQIQNKVEEVIVSIVAGNTPQIAQRKLYHDAETKLRLQATKAEPQGKWYFPPIPVSAIDVLH